MKTEEEQQQWRLERGQYLGDVSALCFLPHFPFPFLLAGTGSEILVYQLPRGNKIASFQVFEGIRVHGVTAHHQYSDSLASSYTIAAFGERRVKLCKFHIRKTFAVYDYGDDNITTDHVDLTILSSLPKLTHWVLDVCFLQNDSPGYCSSNHCQEGYHWIAIGCSDNSVWFWDILSSCVISQVRCPDKCLLYSMRIWGSDVESLLIASGTIYNQIVVWKLDFKKHFRALKDPVEDLKYSKIDEVSQFSGRQCKVVCIGRLTGHEGSIFRIAWSSDGSKLVSASDDRSVRVWVVNTREEHSCSSEDVQYLIGPVLFGHGARVWDCCIVDNLIVTAGEDCTCRVWGQDGRELKVIKEHNGRGVWRCLYDPMTSLIVTAGLDSAVKVYQIHLSSLNSSDISMGSDEDSTARNEVFKFIVPNCSGRHIGLTDSKSEYVRCLNFSRENSLYVSTNNGYLHHIRFDIGEEKWTELAQLDEGAPVVCMDLLSETSELPDTADDWIAMGSGNGSLMVVHVGGHVWSPKIQSTFVWSAEIERQLLGTYWCKSLGNRFIFTADPGGQLKLWRLWGSLVPDYECVDVSQYACLIATYTSCFRTRIMCLDASPESEVLVCGDIHGNILLFPLPRGILFGTSAPSEVKTSPLSYFKGAHGISRVCSISITSSSMDQVEFCSTGQDGCICYLEHNKILSSLEFIGMKTVKEINSICSVFWKGNHNDDLDSKGYAVGFSSSNFTIWNFTADTKVLKVACGGWRRPHSYYIGKFPEINTCFAFVKNEVIYVHRNWVHKKSEEELYPQNLHLQFHGMEIHVVCFIMGTLDFSSEKKHDQLSKTVEVATGCEDGTVRLTRYEPGSKNWTSSKLLGEHVGGSAVRSLCCVSKMYKMVLDVPCLLNEVNRQNWTMEDSENPFLLISVGAKRVVTAWKQRLPLTSCREALYVGSGARDEDKFRGSSFSFQWLSTDMPTRNRNHDKRQNTKIEKEAIVNAYSRTNELNISENGNEVLKDSLADKCENDWRYLAVTAFLVKVVESRISVCFVVVASSDATLTLRALLLPCRLWFDVAMLSPSSSPVLALQHVIISKCSQIHDKPLVRSIYIVISGSTDGSIAFWDLTKDVEEFLRQISSLPINDLVNSQKRPRTGRGSQGGRWWRTLGSHVLKKKPSDDHEQGGHFQNGKKKSGSLGHKTVDKDENKMRNHTVHTVSMTSDTTFSGEDALVLSLDQEENADDKSVGVHEIAPLHVLENVHQSGVNCLHVSDVKDMNFSGNAAMFYLLSGGDDQALNCLGFNLTMKAASETHESSLVDMHRSGLSDTVNSPMYTCETHNYVMKFLSVEKIMSAHSCAIKGVWTDGNWVFSIGLDQRIRCWKFRQLGKLIEYGHLIVSVPEPEALDAHACGRGHYEIVVAGRGMQMVKFCAC